MITWFKDKKKIRVPLSPKKKDDFTSISSHELRTPLSIIKWYTEMLLDEDAGPLTEEQRKYLLTIESSNQRAIDLVRSLLNVSRLELGTFSITPTEVLVTEIVEEILAGLSKEIVTKNLIVTKEYQDTLPKISLDRKLCCIIIKSILTNAISYTKDGGVITVQCNFATQGSIIGGRVIKEESVVVSVTDTGIGIPSEEQSKVFSKMFKASNSKESNGQGSGLALYIAKTIAEHTEGDVWFISEEGKGSTFCCAFPTCGVSKKEGTTTLD